MIKTDSKHTQLEGDICQLLSDLTNTIRHMHTMMTDEFGKQFADDNIALCGKLAICPEILLNDDNVSEEEKILIQKFVEEREC